jgi:hypothetical protein
MVKIETAVKITPEAPAGVAMQFMWMDGLRWPVPDDDEGLILKVEVFGPELDLMKDFPDGEMIRQESTGKVVEVVWYGAAAIRASAYLREKYSAR